ncbi:MAG: hypothetical protein QOJ99_852 [Bryobacterales bacterium]|jgi:hypothetical protein|nr:hypothetical protein [Bryobacterales bacterium]
MPLFYLSPLEPKTWKRFVLFLVVVVGVLLSLSLLVPPPPTSSLPQHPISD